MYFVAMQIIVVLSKSIDTNGKLHWHIFEPCHFVSMTKSLSESQYNLDKAKRTKKLIHTYQNDYCINIDTTISKDIEQTMERW